GHIAAARIHGNPRGFGDCYGEIEAAAAMSFRLHQHGIAADGDVRGLGVEDLARLGLVVGIGHLVRLHLHGVSLSGGDTDVTARILNLDHRVGGNLGVEDLLILVVLRTPEHVEEIVVVVTPLGAHGPPPLVAPGGKHAEDGEKNQDAHEVAAAAYR